ncbi:integral membrane protein [Trichoderma reesei RUT C-30]|uniref:Integral membrane protein n=1 Tax=Hypocrea jecorina (strain ATCC 56765 / BCRC 32924 / NRRL 11460 / Rut C-30) TaxID=1344414 RepID=A0A024RXN1_HYPJR|nr:integral membrane protein [Trichoderma reesei RUT C-30]
MANDLTTTVYEPIQPEGLALSLMVVTIVFTILSGVVVLLRFWIRLSHSLFAVEDWLMLAGWLINLGHNAAVIVLSYSGIGSHDDVITVGMQFHIGLWTIIWQFLYVLDGALIKSSIIWTLLRLSEGVGVVYTRILWALFALGWIVWQISWPVAIFQCKPVAAAWGEPGDCLSGQRVILNVSYFVSAANIFTDFSTALVPIFLLRHVQMPRKLKLITMGILSLGVLASVATIIRISYTWAYTAPSERYYTIAKIVMLTVLECDLGIIAGSMPMLRHLLRLIAPSLANTDGTPEQSRDVNLVTIGGSTGARRTRMKLSKAGGPSTSEERNYSEDKESTDDETSSRRYIMRATCQVEQDSVID